MGDKDQSPEEKQYIETSKATEKNYTNNLTNINSESEAQLSSPIYLPNCEKVS